MVAGDGGRAEDREGAGSMTRRQRRLADPAQPQAGHRDAELRGRDVAVGVVERAPHGARAAVLPSAISWSMRVLRTVTSENSAATKNPLANTSARTASDAEARWDVSIIRGSFADSIGRG